MKELVVVSGKGGTGKTSISAALAHIVPDKVLADCDVDAANLNLVLNSKIIKTEAFSTGFIPYVFTVKCTKCGGCTRVCRFDAIISGTVDELACEGCGACAFSCPERAIAMGERPAGQWMISNTPYGQLVHASLEAAIENSGKLVSKVRIEAKKLAKKIGKKIIITDGPPGIGCPVIATLTGADAVLVVVEPSLSGMHDLERIESLTTRFRLPLAVCINKSTLHLEHTDQIIAWCNTKGYQVVGTIPYDESFYHAVREGKTIMDMGNRKIIKEVYSMCEKLMNMEGMKE